MLFNIIFPGAALASTQEQQIASWEQIANFMVIGAIWKGSELAPSKI